MEIFFPGGFAHDYQWTTRALGMAHIAVWNDTYVLFSVFSWFLIPAVYPSYHTYETKPKVDYPEGFQGNNIPVHGPSVAQIIEDRVAGFLV